MAQAETNESVRGEIAALTVQCKELLGAIKGKTTVSSAEYLVEVERTPLAGGLHVESLQEDQGQRQGGGSPHAAVRPRAAPVAQWGGGQARQSLQEINVPKLTVVRRALPVPARDILSAQRFSLSIKQVPDLFNDKLDYNVSR